MAQRLKYTAFLQDLMTRPLMKIEGQGKRTFDRLDRELDQFQNNVRQTNRPLGGLSRKLGSVTGPGMGGLGGFRSMLYGAVPAMGVFAGAAGLGLITAKVIGLGVAMEQTRVSFEVMLGSAKAGNAMIRELQEFANVTPFTTEETVLNARKLLAYNIEAKKLLPTLRVLGDIASGVGKEKMGQLILAFGQVKAATRLTGMELRQFTEAGVPLLDMLTKQTGMTTAHIKEKMIPAGQISFAMVEKAMRSATDEGGKFHKLMERISQTAGGRWSTLIGKLQLIGEHIGESTTGGLKRIINVAIDVVDWFRSNLHALGEMFRPLVEAYSPLKEAIREIGVAFGATGEKGSFLKSVFNLIGNSIKFVSPILKSYFQSMSVGFRIVARLVSKLREFLSGSSMIGKTMKGVAVAIRSMFLTLQESLRNVLSGTGSLLVGIFEGDLAKIKSGLGQLYSGAIKGNTISLGVSGYKGFKDGYKNGIGWKDFFAGHGKKEGSHGAGEKGSGLGNLTGLDAGGSSSLVDGLSSVTGSVKSRNVVINVENLVREFNIVSENVNEIGDQMRAEIGRIFSEILNDASIVAGQ